MLYAADCRVRASDAQLSSAPRLAPMTIPATCALGLAVQKTHVD